MDTLASCPPRELQRRLSSVRGLRLQTGPFIFGIRSHLPEVATGLALHYRHHPLMDADEEEGFCDFRVVVDRPWGWRRFLRPQVRFRLDGAEPFQPLPGDQGYAMLEWGMNWAISSHAHQHIIIHAAVVARGQRALVLPAPSGSGKSTLCAALMLRGWRLLSDELALLSPQDGLLRGLARPVSLKNESIDAIRHFDPQATLGKPVRETVKGVVAHLSPAASSVQVMQQPARAAWVVVPRFHPAGSDAPSAPTAWGLRPLSRAQGFMELQRNTFNYDLHGVVAFDTLGRLMTGCSAHELHYQDLNTAVQACEGLVPEAP